MLKKIRMRAQKMHKKLLDKAKRWTKKHNRRQKQIAKQYQQRMNKHVSRLISAIRMSLRYRRYSRAAYYKRQLVNFQKQRRRMQQFHTIKLEKYHQDFRHHLRAQLFAVRRKLRHVERKIMLTTSQYRIRGFRFVSFSLPRRHHKRLRGPKRRLRKLHKVLKKKFKAIHRRLRRKGKKTRGHRTC